MDVILNRRPMTYDHRDFSLRDFITPEMRLLAEETISRDWLIDDLLNQEDSPHCVGFAWANFGNSAPVRDKWVHQMGDDIYYAAKIIDGEPGQENGSDTRSGVKAFTQFGVLKTYAFANSIDDIITWVLTVGPVVTGTNWYKSMMDTTSTGLMKVSGRLIGGHEWMISGVDKFNELFHCTNSWGTDWAVNGQFFISFVDYERLFNEQGDAVTAMEIEKTPPPPPPPVSDRKLSEILTDLQTWSVRNNL